MRGQVFGAFRECSADVHALLRETATAAAAREWRESGPHHMTRRELPTFPSSAAAGAAPSRSPVLASGCHGRTSRGVTVTITMRPTPGAWPRASTLATPHAWLRSSLPSSAGPPPGSVAIRLRARARARARTRTRAHAHTHAHTCSHVCSLLLHVSLVCPTCATGLLLC